MDCMLLGVQNMFVTSHVEEHCPPFDIVRGILEFCSIIITVLKDIVNTQICDYINYTTETDYPTSSKLITKLIHY